jgi:hypothetical protein
MKTISVIAVLALALQAGAELITNLPARLACKVEWHDKGSTGTGGSSVDPSPGAIYPGNSMEDTCTTRGYEYDLKWAFLGRDGNHDVYRFTFIRDTKQRGGPPIQTTTTKDVPFDGKEVVVFDDDLHTVIMKSPDQSDLQPQRTK